ncbi:MAG: sodium ion-translocating decarboxylase subunit beta [Clostridia bacterium]|nr:sodium ion-translocating decarboxylase subunit beta [Clostridia bacterium]
MSEVISFAKTTGFWQLFGSIGQNWGSLVMIAISLLLLWLGIKKQFEPLLLVGIAFGMLLTNLTAFTPNDAMYHTDLWAAFMDHNNPAYHSFGTIMSNGGLLDILYIGVKTCLYPCLIFVGIGAMTDFEPLIANPKSLLLGAAAQIGIFATFISCVKFFPSMFPQEAAASIGIIGGADGPTAIYTTSRLYPDLLGPIAVAAYSYMALVPVIQPPIMKLLTTKKERNIIMKPLRKVSKTEKIIFPIAVTIVVSLLVPSATPLIGCLMLGNLWKESGVCDRLCKTAQNELMNIVTIFLGISVGATATAEAFLNGRTLAIMCMGVIAFGLGSAGGVLLAKFMNLFTKNKVNPLIGSAGVSAVPMAARVSQSVGQKENPSNFLLMHAMGPNVAGVIGSAIAAGVLISLFG